MAYGIPVFTSNWSALAEVAGDAAVLVNPQNTEEIVAAIIASWRMILNCGENLGKRGTRASEIVYLGAGCPETHRVYEELKSTTSGLLRAKS